MKTQDSTLINALRILARDIESEDGIANALLQEAAERFAELVLQNHECHAQSVRYLGQFERCMLAAQWLRSSRPASKRFKAAEAELDALEKEVQA